MLKALRTSAMLLIIAGSAQAGEILTPPAPQQPQTIVAQEPTTDDSTETETTPTLIIFALDLLAVLPSLL